MCRIHDISVLFNNVKTILKQHESTSGECQENGGFNISFI